MISRSRGLPGVRRPRPDRRVAVPVREELVEEVPTFGGGDGPDVLLGEGREGAPAPRRGMGMGALQTQELRRDPEELRERRAALRQLVGAQAEPARRRDGLLDPADAPGPAAEVVAEAREPAGLQERFGGRVLPPVLAGRLGAHLGPDPARVRVVELLVLLGVDPLEGVADQVEEAGLERGGGVKSGLPFATNAQP